MKKVYFQFAAVLLTWSHVSAELVHLQVMHRHGDRMPDDFMYFPTQPANERVPWPGEKGELTRIGVEQLYTLGQNLRTRYGAFVDVDKTPSQLYVNAGNDNRTASSALALLAGWWPATTDNRIDIGLNWRPIPIHTDRLLDVCTMSFVEKCPRLGKKMLNSEDFANVNEKYAYLLPYLSEKSGLPITNAREATKVFDLLKVQSLAADSAIRPWPAWTNEGPLKGVDVDLLDSEISSSIYRIPFVHEKTAGFTYSVIVDYIDKYLKNLTKHHLVIHSQHDTNIRYLTDVLKPVGLDVSRNPLYGCHFIVELHKDAAGLYEVKILYSPTYNETAKEYEMGTCPSPCRPETFASIMPHVSAEEWKHECGIDDEYKIIESGRKATVILGILTAVFALLWLGTCCCCCCDRRKAKKKAETERLLAQGNVPPRYI